MQVNLADSIQKTEVCFVSSNSMMNVVKGAAIGLAAGMAVGVIGKNAVDNNPKLKKKANKAMRTMESIMDTAQYMFK